MIGTMECRGTSRKKKGIIYAKEHKIKQKEKIGFPFSSINLIVDGPSMAKRI